MADVNPVIAPEGVPVAPEAKPEDLALNSEAPAEAEGTTEQGIEQVNETTPEQAGANTAGATVAPIEPVTAVAPAVVAPPVEKSEELKAIEGILAEGLEEMYSNLPDNRKEEFKVKGEETATRINIMLQAVKIQAGKVVDLIKKWLSMIPGVNKFFLEQESKIKADKLLAYKNEREGKV